MLGDDFEVDHSFTDDNGTTYYITEVLEVTSRFKIIKHSGASFPLSQENDDDYILTGSELSNVVSTIPGMQSPSSYYFSSVANTYSGRYYVVYNQNVTRGQVLTATDERRYVVTSNASLSKSFRISTSQGGTPIDQ